MVLPLSSTIDRQQLLSSNNTVSFVMNGFFSHLALSPERGYRFTRHFIFWATWWLFFGFIYGVPASTGAKHTVFLGLAFVEALLYLPQHMFLSYGIIYVILPKLLLKGRWWTGLLAVIVLILLTAMMSQVVAAYAIIPIRTSLNIPYQPSTQFYASLMAGLRGSMTVAGFAVAIKLIKLWYVKKMDNERLEKATLRAELELLKGQLHPHFMFNTLNTIYSFALNKSDKTPQAILELSQLMRYMLTDCAKPLVELGREIQILRDYIQLERERFGPRLDISINCTGDIDNKIIPPLLLMPFVENSFKHGAGQMIEQAWISLDLTVKDDVLRFKLINGKPTEVHSKQSSLVGLLNVRRRLNLLYPQAHDLRISEDEDMFVVNLTLQLNKVTLPEVYEHISMSAH
ncbi:histidine kinase [Chryseolinea sp. T2]|uniref:sensor histidine kinase n=1 Tax=Chryseolinea sp. T2 TaxID=3129255 RepID=UPI0030772E9C